MSGRARVGVAVAGLTALALLTAGCGGGGEEASGTPKVEVSGASERTAHAGHHMLKARESLSVPEITEQGARGEALEAFWDYYRVQVQTQDQMDPVLPEYASVMVGNALGTRQIDQNDANVGEARKADRLIDEAGFTVDAKGESVDEVVEMVLVQSKTLTVEDPAFRAVIHDVENTLDRVRAFLAAGVIGGTALALIAGLLLSRRAMSPIAALTGAARDIARTGDPHSAAAEFFINVVDNKRLDYTGDSNSLTWGYCVFGKVVSGQDIVDNQQRLSVTHRRSAETAVELGIPLAAGTDCGVRGVTSEMLWREIWNLHDHGLSAMDAIKAGTANGARVMGLTDRGTLEAGMRADLVMVWGDPLTDLRRLSDLSLVMKAGAIVRRTV